MTQQEKDDYKRGYEDAMKQIEDMLKNGQDLDSAVNNAENDLETMDDKNGQGNKNQNKNQNQGDGLEGIGNQGGWTDHKTTQKAAESATASGGWIDQETASEIAQSEGYEGREVRKENNSGEEFNKAVEDAISKYPKAAGVKTITSAREEIARDFKAKKSMSWKQELKKFVGRALGNIPEEEKWGRKRALARGELQKFGVASTGSMSDVLFAVDVSSSVSASDLEKVLQETYDICYTKNIKDVTYIYHTTQVELVETTKNRLEARKLNPNMVKLIKNQKGAAKGKLASGGTNFECVMKFVDENFKKSKPELLIFFTDGYAHVVPKPSRVKTMIWAIFDNLNFKAVDNSKVIHLTFHK